MFALLGFLISTIGSILGIIGALMMARTYHPFSLWGFVRFCLTVVTWKLVSGRLSQVAQSNEIAAKLGNLNEDRRGYSLAGLQLVFLGFCVQLLGSAVSFISGHFWSFS